jgi:hypothetical protein
MAAIGRSHVTRRSPSNTPRSTNRILRAGAWGSERGAGGTLAASERTARWWRLTLASLAVIVLLICAWALLQQSGVSAPLPAESAIDRMNRKYGGIAPNAAEYYEELLALLPQDTLQGLYGEARRRECALAPEIVAWLDDHEDFSELARLAARCERCYFALRDAGNGYLKLTVYGQWRPLATYLSLRARRAAEAHDLPRFSESIWMLDRLGRHARQQPVMVAQMFHSLFRLQAQEWLLVPLTWPELSAAEREAYLDIAEDFCDELPLEIQPFREDAELNCWAMRNVLGAGPRMLVSRARLNGELQKQLDPFEAMLAQPIEQRLMPGNPLRMALAPGPSRRTPAKYIFNFPGVIADLAAYTFDGFIQSDAKLVERQRGTRAALRVLRHQLRSGEWPTSLAELRAPLALDPFAAQPYRYRRAGDDFVLYGVGIDRDDDGGTPIPRPHRHRPWNAATASAGDVLIWPLWEDCEENE